MRDILRPIPHRKDLTSNVHTLNPFVEPAHLSEAWNYPQRGAAAHAADQMNIMRQAEWPEPAFSNEYRAYTTGPEDTDR